jgi:hypothetical protein
MRMSLEELHAVCARDGIPTSAYDVVSGFYQHTLDRIPEDELPVNIAPAFIDHRLRHGLRQPVCAEIPGAAPETRHDYRL